MQILAHRGYWFTSDEKNTREALNSAFENGFGIETDIRDLDGQLVVSHDPARRGALPLIDLLSDYVKFGYTGTLALNIKSDGLTERLRCLLRTFCIDDYFCFDMSVPDTFPYIEAKLTTAARLSEYEPEGLLSALTSVLWVDSFYDLKISHEQIQDWINRDYRVCLVSPELHGRSYHPFFRALAEMPASLRLHNNLMICTDHPEVARDLLR